VVAGWYLFKRNQQFGHVFAELAVLKTQLEVALERQSELEEENKVSVMMIPAVSPRRFLRLLYIDAADNDFGCRCSWPS
jgi:hypothetical protein